MSLTNSQGSQVLSASLYPRHVTENSQSVRLLEHGVLRWARIFLSKEINIECPRNLVSRRVFSGITSTQRSLLILGNKALKSQ